MLECAETFLDGGTNFDNPLQEACRLMRSEDFEKPDIVFITDGVCEVSPEILDAFQQMKRSTIHWMAVSSQSRSRLKMAVQ